MTAQAVRQEERDMSKLTDSQLIVLSAAAARDDGAAVAPAKMTKAAAAKVGASLVARKLMREVKAKPGMPVWRHDEDGRPLSLAITRAGEKAIGVEKAAAQEKVCDKEKRGSGERTDGGASGNKASRRVVEADLIATPRPGSKQALMDGV